MYIRYVRGFPGKKSLGVNKAYALGHRVKSEGQPGLIDLRVVIL